MLVTLSLAQMNLRFVRTPKGSPDAVPVRAAHRRDVGCRSVWRRAAPQAHGGGSSRRTGDRHLAAWPFLAYGDDGAIIPSRDRGINGGTRLRGETVYAAKALDRRESPAGNASALGCGVALSPRTPCRQCSPCSAQTPNAAPAREAGAGGWRLAGRLRTFGCNTCRKLSF